MGTELQNPYRQKLGTILIYASSHLRTLASLTFLSAAVSTIAAFQFRSAATASIRAPDDLAAFFGVFNSCAGLVALAAQASAGRVLQRLGPGPT